MFVSVGATTTLAGCLQSSIRRVAEETDTETSAGPTVRDTDSVTVAVGPGDDGLGFHPGSETPLRIRSGTTVVFVWRTDTHNIVVAAHPESADWQGTEGGAGTTYDAGHRHEHTFTVPGRYEFYCTPHETLFPHAVLEVVDG